ncbi:MAG: hypothetical protein HYU27_08310 [Acidobacteria bacterium]|nr:hypothetical protein [Acidobacteriota bacterium]
MFTTPRVLRLIFSSGGFFACLGAAAVVAFMFSPAAAAQASQPAQLPNGPAKPGFDITRFSSAGNGWFETFHVQQTQLLMKALDEGKVAEDTRLLVTQTAGGKLALLMDQMAYHHIAQGTAGGKDWMATF